MSNLATTIIKVHIHQKGDNPVFGESVISVSLADEAAGPFLVIGEVRDDSESGEVKLDVDELEAMYAAAKMLLRQSSINDQQIETEGSRK